MKHYRVFLLLILAAMMVAPAVGQTPYKLPPKDVVAILDAPLPPMAIVSPTRDALLLVEIRPYPSIASLAEPRSSPHRLGSGSCPREFCRCC